MGTLYHPSLASFDSAEHTVLQKGVKSFLRIEPGRCMGAESGGDSVRKEQMSCGRRVDITAAKRLGTDNRGDSAGFRAARQDAQLPRLTVHWLSVTRDN